MTNERRSGLGQQSTVNRLVSQAHDAQKAAHSDGRGKPGNAGQLGRDKEGVTKATYALPISRQDWVREIAEAEDVSKTDIAEAAIVAFYNAWKAGRVDLSGLKLPAKSLRFSWHLEIPDELSFF